MVGDPPVFDPRMSWFWCRTNNLRAVFRPTMPNNSTVVQKDAPPGRLYDLLKEDDTAQLQNNCPVSKNLRISTATIRVCIFLKTSLYPPSHA
jgi:hypothetical protein